MPLVSKKQLHRLACAHREGEAEQVGERQAGRAEGPEQRCNGGHARAAELRQVEAVEAGNDACTSNDVLLTRLGICP